MTPIEAEAGPLAITPTLRIVQPSIRDLRIEGLAMVIRENSRFPSGTPRISPEKAREIAEYGYQYLVAAGAIGPVTPKRMRTIDGSKAKDRP